MCDDWKKFKTAISDAGLNSNDGVLISEGEWLTEAAVRGANAKTRRKWLRNLKSSPPRLPLSCDDAATPPPSADPATPTGTLRVQATAFRLPCLSAEDLREISELLDRSPITDLLTQPRFVLLASRDASLKDFLTAAGGGDMSHQKHLAGLLLLEADHLDDGGGQEVELLVPFPEFYERDRMHSRLLRFPFYLKIGIARSRIVKKLVSDLVSRNWAVSDCAGLERLLRTHRWSLHREGDDAALEDEDFCGNTAVAVAGAPVGVERRMTWVVSYPLCAIFAANRPGGSLSAPSEVDADLERGVALGTSGELLESHRGEAYDPLIRKNIDFATELAHHLGTGLVRFVEKVNALEGITFDRTHAYCPTCKNHGHYSQECLADYAMSETYIRVFDPRELLKHMMLDRSGVTNKAAFERRIPNAFESLSSAPRNPGDGAIGTRSNPDVSREESLVHALHFLLCEIAHCVHLRSASVYGGRILSPNRLRDLLAYGEWFMRDVVFACGASSDLLEAHADALHSLEGIYLTRRMFEAHLEVVERQRKISRFVPDEAVAPLAASVLRQLLEKIESDGTEEAKASPAEQAAIGRVVLRTLLPRLVDRCSDGEPDLTPQLTWLSRQWALSSGEVCPRCSSCLHAQQ